ncbi:hypothetical protein EV44_g3476 [Erysiphe necator]|uniref:Uncharacterized protein n=1 Tax=Uncinula necator TaxID=52586 RepID=A0A0B1NVM2_UNCNE|nr:hypothetical protein EV44_g3476 [Erysiphe necator]
MAFKNTLALDLRCSIVGSQSGKGKYCAKLGHCMCANCGGKYMANASTCAVHKQAIAIARNGRKEWKKREKEYEIRSFRQENDNDSESRYGEDIREASQEISEVELKVSRSLEMEICENTVPNTLINYGGTNLETI